MPNTLYYSNLYCYDMQDDPFSRFLENNPIRMALIDDEPHYAIRDIIKSLGWAETSTQYLTRKCYHYRRLTIPGTKGGTTLNMIPMEDIVRLVFHGAHNSNTMVALRKWFLALIVEQARKNREDWDIPDEGQLASLLS